MTDFVTLEKRNGNMKLTEDQIAYLKGWRIGRPGTIVSDRAGFVGQEAFTGSDSEYYLGAFLICESIAPKDAGLILSLVKYALEDVA